jgi:hypothetical protein
MQAILHYAGPEQTVDAVFRLRNTASGQRISATAPVQVRSGVALVTVLDIQAPLANYSPELEILPHSDNR